MIPLLVQHTGVRKPIYTGNSKEFNLFSLFTVAPEVFESQVSMFSDIWSFGCTVIELLTGSPPYRELPKEVAVCNIIENDLPPFPTGISANLQEFLKCCFKKTANERSSAKSLLEHPWLLKNATSSQSRPSSMDITKYRDIHDVMRPFKIKVDVSNPDGE